MTGTTTATITSATNESNLDIYDEIEIEDMTFDPRLQIYHYPCPCGDRFEIALASLREGEEIAVCPSCSLMIRVVFDAEDLPSADDHQDEGTERDGERSGGKEKEKQKEGQVNVRLKV